MPLDFMELVTKIPNEQEIRLMTSQETVLYAGKCGNMPFSTVKEAEEMMVASVIAAGDKLCILLEGIDDLHFPFADEGEFDDFE